MKYKLAIIGKSGVGKTALVCLLSNQREFATSSQIPPGETPGVRYKFFKSFSPLTFTILSTFSQKNVYLSFFQSYDRLLAGEDR